MTFISLQKRLETKMPKGIYIRTEEHNKRTSETMKGRKLSKEHKEKLSKIMKGKQNALGCKYTEEIKHKMSLARMGENNPNYGKDFSMEKHPNWKGGRVKVNNYICIKKPEHPFPNKQNYVYEHRLIMEKFLGRYLKPKEVVHHKGTKYPIGSIEDKQDNRIENLMLFTNNGEHLKYHEDLIDKRNGG